MSKQRGFTLIEVLIAVVILGIALLAITKLTQQAIVNSNYLQDKTTAGLVAKNILAKARSAVIALPQTGAQTSGEIKMLMKTWYWTLAVNASDDIYMAKLIVNVYDSQQRHNLMTLTGYLPRNKSGQLVYQR
ncbi:MAG: type II secretion system minor pseudopilin GspI [Gammaproteobacteria bacterium]|nr:type II secretion system minor pseudopilin GspI [Gammaproteobacteria bacterium]